ncbi:MULTISPECIES: plastocyanin/azurin family copper-binding protein [Haloferax]|uniref:plastocyanin/azurin family copper-binding protein n=1 Tax=Haloferax TaxID=2251 RepID=UPI001781CB55|nr:MULTISPECIES: plastocyanin/azurin family copper-binding protein [Haloferax]
MIVSLTGCLGEDATGSEETTPARTPPPTPESETTEAPVESTTATRTATPQSGIVTVDVGPGTVFRPFDVAVVPGTTVKWVWRDGGHNVVVDERPENSEWRGHGTIEDTGYVYEYEFTVEGTYRYYCSPHRAQGMAGAIHVR